MPESVISAPAQRAAVGSAPNREQRRNPRARVSLSVRVRPMNPEDGQFEDVRVTMNASRTGLYFTTAQPHYRPRMQVLVAFPYGPAGSSHDREDTAQVVRVDRLSSGRFGVALCFAKPASPGVTHAQGKPQPAASKKQESERRTAFRYSFTVAAQVTEVTSGSRLTARVSDLSLEGCYVDTLNPFPEGSCVRVQFLKGKEVFETGARVSYSDAGLGMGLAFAELTAEQHSFLTDCLSELGVELEPTRKQLPSLPAADREITPEGAALAKLIRTLIRKSILSYSEGQELLREFLS
jgi:hypothetical protein